MTHRCVLLAAVLVLAAGRAPALPMQVAFETNTVPLVQDPFDLVPDGLVAPATSFTGHFTYDPDAPDLDPDPARGRFAFTGSESLTVSIGALTLDFDLDEISYFYSTASGVVSFYRLRGSASGGPFPVVTTLEIQLHFAQTSGLSGALGLVDAPVDPLPGSPWEDGSGASLLSIFGTNGLPGEAERFFVISNVLGSYEDPVPVPEPATWVLLAAGALGLACRGAAARRR